MNRPRNIPGRLLLATLAALLSAASAPAVILHRTGEPSANTSAPSGAFTDSGWQYQGLWGSLSGTPIAPHFFIGAKHGGGPAQFVFQGLSYTVVRHFPDPTSDLSIWQVAEPFPIFAPLYSRTDEVGQTLTVFGRGTERGGEIRLNDILRGWFHGPSGGSVRRWGLNMVHEIALVGDIGSGAIEEALYATFDANGMVDENIIVQESHLSGGDSGGAVFLNDGGSWKLAGINYAIDGSFYLDSAGSGKFNGALFDARDFWVQNESPPPPYRQVTGTSDVPSGFYSTRISTKLPWIASVVAEQEAGREGIYVTLTYTKLLVPLTDLTYTVEKSSDLITWTPTTTIDDIIETNASTQRVKAKVDIEGADHLFVRLKISRPGGSPRLNRNLPARSVVPLEFSRRDDATRSSRHEWKRRVRAK